MAGLDLRTTRVMIRPPRSADAEEFTQLMRRSRQFHGLWARMPATGEQFDHWLKRGKGKDSDRLLVCLKNGGQIVGTIGFSHIIRGRLQQAFVGYCVGEPYAGQGYMTEGLALAVRRAFAQLKLHRLEANIQPGNAASIALAKRCGFTMEGYSRRYLKLSGRWRDHERWALLAEDWRAMRRGRPVTTTHSDA